MWVRGDFINLICILNERTWLSMMRKYKNIIELRQRAQRWTVAVFHSSTVYSWGSKHLWLITHLPNKGKLFGFREETQLSWELRQEGHPALNSDNSNMQSSYPLWRPLVSKGSIVCSLLYIKFIYLFIHSEVEYFFPNRGTIVNCL